MPRFATAAALAFGLAASVSAQSASVTSSAAAASGSVVSIFLLDEDPQTLVASLVGSSNSLTTLAIQCGPNVDADSCGYPTPVTVTAGPSTVHASASISGIRAEYGCDLTGTTTGACSITYIGDATDLATDSAELSTATGTVTVSTSGTLTAGDITYYPITVTAGLAAAASGSASSTATSGASGHTSASTASASGSHSGSSASSAATSKTSGAAASASSAASSASHSASSAASAASSSASNAVSSLSAGAANAAKAVAPGAFAAAILGLAALL